MQKIKFKFVKALQTLLLTPMVIVICFSSCKDPEPEKSSEKIMSNVVVIAAQQEFSTQLEATTFKFEASLQFSVENPNAFTSATVSFTLSEGATSDPKSGDPVNLNEEVTYIVTAEDGTTTEYFLQKVDGTSSEANFLAFKLLVGEEELVGEIDNSDFTVAFFPTFEMWNDFATATPIFEISLGASAEINSGEPGNFTQPVEVAVTAHDGTTRDWTVIANGIALGTLNNRITYTVTETQTEEVEDGIWYMKATVADATRPLVIHTVRYHTSYYQQYSIETWVAHDSIRGKESPGAMVNRYAQAGKDVRMAINGGFYGTEVNGTPITMQKINGTLSFLPVGDYPIIGFDNRNRPYMDAVTLNSKVRREKDDAEHEIISINGQRWADYLVLYNSYMGKYTRTNEWGTEMVLTPVDGDWETLDSHIEVRCRVETVVRSGMRQPTEFMEIPKGKIVLSGHGAANTYLGGLETDDYVYVTVDYFLRSQPEITSTTIRNIVSGWNIILNNNAVMPYVTTDQIERANHPRTSVGFTNDKEHVFFTVIEGRNPGVSMGVNTQELARIMQYFGAENAINLDGGGSSCMILDKKLVNMIETGTWQRPVADGLAIIKK